MSTQSVAEFFQELKEKNVIKGLGFQDYDLKLRCLATLLDGLPTLVVYSNRQLPEFKSSTAVSVSRVEPQPGAIYVYLKVTESRFENLFYKLCSDLLGVMEGAPNEAAAASRMAARYEMWREFWKSGRGALSEEAVKGLAGELLHLRDCLRAGADPDETVRGWLGPGRKNQDFVFPDGWAEVKTVGQSASEVRISSLEQLVNPDTLSEAEGGARGRLVIFRLQNDPAGERSFTLTDVCSEIIDMLADRPHAHNHFVNSLEMTGADILRGELERKLRLQVLEKMVYDVNAPGFPRLIRNDAVPAAVTKAAYSLSIPALEPWRIEEEAADEA